jgi:hypothetical protein
VIQRGHMADDGKATVKHADGSILVLPAAAA